MSKLLKSRTALSLEILELEQKCELLQESLKIQSIKYDNVKKDLENQNLIFSCLENINDELVVYSFDTEYRYTSFNRKHAAEMKQIWGIDIKTGLNILDCIKDETIREISRKCFDRTLSGTSSSEINSLPGSGNNFETTWKPVIRNGIITGGLSTIQNISEKQIELVTIAKNEELYRTTLDRMLEGCQIIGSDWRYIYLNHAAAIHNRRPNNELIGKRYMDMWPGIEETEVFEAIKHTLEKRESHHFENEFVFPDGSLGWFDLSIQPVPEGVFILSIDITERKSTESQLFESEKKYRLIADNSNDWIYWIAPDGRLLYVSPACERVTGYSPEEFANRPDLLQTIVFEPDRARFLQHTDSSKIDDTPHNVEFRILTKADEIRWIDHSCSPIFDSERKYLGRRGTNRNISESKLREGQLFESEFRFSNLFENGPFGMVMADDQFRFKKVNPTFCSLLNYSAEELVQLTFSDVTHPEDLAKDLINIKKLRNNEIPVYKAEKRYVRKDGETIWGSLTVTPTYDREAQFLYYLAIIEDITHRKQIEVDLRKSKKLLSETESIGNVGGWEFNIDTLEQIWTDEVYHIHEVDLDFKQNVNQGINFYAPASRPIIEQAIKRVLESGEPFDLELEIITAKGNLRKVHTIGKADPENRRVYGFFQDITERKRVEEQLHQSESRFSKMFNLGPVAKSLVKVSTRKVIDFNKAAEMLFEVKREEIVGKLNEDLDFWANHSQRTLVGEIFRKQGFLRGFEFQYKTATGKTGWASGYAEIIEIDSEEYSYNEYVDITDRKLAEEKIRELNERISTATHASRIGIWDWDVKNNVLEWDDEMHRLYGIQNREFIGEYESWLNGLHPDDLEYCQNEMQRALLGEKEYDIEFRIVWRDGTVRNAKAKGEVFRNKSGEPVRMVGINYDITEQKKKDEKIRQKDQEFRKLSANVPDLLFQFTRKPDGTYFVPIASEGIRNIFGCEPEDVINDFSPIARVIHPDDSERVIRDIEYSAEHMTYFTCEFRVQIPGREIQWIYSKSTPEKLPDGSITWYGFNTDITQKKLAEEALRYNEALLSEVGHIAHVGGWEFDPANGQSTWTKEVARIHDFDPETPASVNLRLNYYTEHSKPLIEKAFNDLIELAKPYDLELEMITIKGNHKWIRTIGRPIFENGNIVKLQGSFQDITDYKNAQESLRISEEKLRAIFDVLPFGISLIDEDRTIAQMNPVLEKIINLRFSDIATGKHKLRKYLRSDGSEMPPAELASMRAIEENRVIKDIETGIQTENGSVFWTTVSAAPVHVKGLSAVVITQDINDRKLAEKALRESEEKFRVLIESIPLPVAYSDIKGEIVFRNERFIKVIGYTYDEVPTINEWWTKAYPDEAYRAQVMQSWESSMKAANETNTDIVQNEYRVTCKNGMERIFVVSGILIDHNLLITFIDITDRTKAEEEIRKLNETLEQKVEERTIQLKEANNELEAFSYSVSHDLRAPLRHINGFVDLLTENYNDILPEKGKHYLDVILNASHHMGTLIDDLLQFSRTGRQEMRQVEHDMNIVLKETLKSLEQDTENRNIEWNITTLPYVNGDQSLLRMVWFNLLSNAIKFTRAKDPAQIQIGFVEDPKEFTFFVRDNGAGFDMNYSHKLFGVFQRLHTIKEFEGTGIGLANVRRIIFKHGGRTWAESQLGKGATFYFTLPKH